MCVVGGGGGGGLFFHSAYYKTLVNGSAFVSTADLFLFD